MLTVDGSTEEVKLGVFWDNRELIIKDFLEILHWFVSMFLISSQTTSVLLQVYADDSGLMMAHRKGHVVLEKVIYVVLDLTSSRPIQSFRYKDVLPRVQAGGWKQNTSNSASSQSDFSDLLPFLCYELCWKASGFF